MANPYNLRGALIQPSGNTGIYYFLILMDYDSTSVIDGTFSLANVAETGNVLTYSYSGTAGSLVAPQSEATTETLALPIYYNQQINAPNLKEGATQNLTVTLAVGGTVISTGNPYFLHPPIVEVIDTTDEGYRAYMCSSVVFTSATAAKTTYFLVYMVNTNTLNVGNPLTYSTMANGEDWDVQVDFGTTAHTGPIAAIGIATTQSKNFVNLYVNNSLFGNPDGQTNPSTPINFSPLPAADYTL